MYLISSYVVDIAPKLTFILFLEEAGLKAKGARRGPVSMWG